MKDNKVKLIRDSLRVADPSLAAEVTGKWAPYFKEKAIRYCERNTAPKNSACTACGEFLYNYYAYISEMIWWSKSPAARSLGKGGRVPDLTAIAREIYADPENVAFLRFAMDLAGHELKDCSFDKLLTRDEWLFQKKITVLYDGRPSDSVDLFTMCCAGERGFTAASRLYFWAYIKYNRDLKAAPAARPVLKDYFVLMRALYMDTATCGKSPVTGKLRLSKAQFGRIVTAFNSVTDGNAVGPDDPYYPAYKAYISDKGIKYYILNNAFVRGSACNVADYLSIQLESNLTWLFENEDDMDSFRRLATCGFGSMRYRSSGEDAGTVFLPVTKKMLTSVLSQRGWRNSPDFRPLMEYLTREEILWIKNKKFGPSDWESAVIDGSAAGDEYGRYPASVLKLKKKK